MLVVSVFGELGSVKFRVHGYQVVFETLGTLLQAILLILLLAFAFPATNQVLIFYCLLLLPQSLGIFKYLLFSFVKTVIVFDRILMGFFIAVNLFLQVFSLE